MRSFGPRTFDLCTPQSAAYTRRLVVLAALAAAMLAGGCDSMLRRRAVELFTPLREPSLVAWHPRQIGDDTAEFFGSRRTVVLVEGTDRVYIKNNSGTVSITNYFLRERELETPAGIGSGAIITADGYILTAAHCVENPPITIVAMNAYRSIGTYSARIVWKGVGGDAETDFALIKIEGDDFNFFTFAEDLDFSAGMAVLATGLGIETTRASGGSLLRRPQPGAVAPEGIATVVEIDNPILPGDSGGPVMLADGTLLGVSSVLQFYYDGSERIGFISRPSPAFIQRLIDEDRARPAPSPATMVP